MARRNSAPGTRLQIFCGMIATLMLLAAIGAGSLIGIEILDAPI